VTALAFMAGAVSEEPGDRSLDLPPVPSEAFGGLQVAGRVVRLVGPDLVGVSPTGAAE
jgi:hypothetical protein